MICSYTCRSTPAASSAYTSACVRIWLMVAEEALDYLDAPIVRVGAPYCPVPFSPPLEKAYIPGADQIIAAVKSLR